MQASKREKKKREGGGRIWDVMGYYDKKRKIVTICDKVIQKGFENKFKRDVELRRELEKLSRTRKELILILRELVRLHEHSHAFLHTARIKGAKPGGNSSFISIKFPAA